MEVRAPAGVIAYEPADLTVTVGAGTSVLDLDSLLAEHGQMCPLDPRDSNATVGGLIAVGLSGVRRLRHGPVRDTVLEVRFVTADGRVVKGGGPTVKNVTGYDLPRLLVGSFGTLGVLVQMTLRCRPRPVAWQWASTTRPVDAVAASLFRPSSVLWDGENTFVLLEGFDRDIGVEARAAQLGPPCEAPALPNGTHRGRISVAPAALGSLRDALNDITGARWLAEWGVGTVHVAGDDPRVLVDARAAAARHGGWLLREAGGDEAFDGFGVALPNGELHRRIKEAFDPNGTCNPGRLPGPHPF
ncbi:MAG: putative oxidase [Actinomycetia bacterium]|nr:putative oxidase [Actinomycetes bacterium]